MPAASATSGRTFWSRRASGAATAPPLEGAVDAIGVGEWDLAAVQVIVEEAGGRFSDFSGESRIDGGTAISSNGSLHEELLAAVAGGVG
jgi:histidinol-phosphatase